MEILQLFTEDLPEEDLLKIRDMLSAYRFRRATEAANKVAMEKGWTAEDFEKLLHDHKRTPHKPAKDASSKPEN